MTFTLRRLPTGIAAGVQAQAKVSVTANYGSINAHCDASAISGQCLVMPANPVAISANSPAAVTITLNVPNTIIPGAYNINVAVADSSGQPSHTLQLPLTVIPDFTVNSATPSQTLAAGQTTSGAYQLSVAPIRQARRSQARCRSLVPAEFLPGRVVCSTRRHRLRPAALRAQLS
jgi:hypothetical protein